MLEKEDSRKKLKESKKGEVDQFTIAFMLSLLRKARSRHPVT